MHDEHDGEQGEAKQARASAGGVCQTAGRRRVPRIPRHGEHHGERPGRTYSALARGGGTNGEVKGGVECGRRKAEG